MIDDRPPDLVSEPWLQVDKWGINEHLESVTRWRVRTGGGKPEYLWMIMAKDREDLAVGMTREQAIKIRDFLIKYLGED